MIIIIQYILTLRYNIPNIFFGSFIIFISSSVTRTRLLCKTCRRIYYSLFGHVSYQLKLSPWQSHPLATQRNGRTGELYICRLIKWYLMKALASQHECLLASNVRNFVKWVLKPCDEDRRSRESSVGIAKVWMSDARFLAEARNYLFSTAYRPALVPIGGSFPGSKATGAWSWSFTSI
jgi:hypothetical protein